MNRLPENSTEADGGREDSTRAYFRFVEELPDIWDLIRSAAAGHGGFIPALVPGNFNADRDIPGMYLP